MPSKQQNKKHDDKKPINLPPDFFACPNSDCADFNKFNAGNLSIAEWMGNDPSASIATALSGIPAGPKGPWRPDYAERGG